MNGCIFLQAGYGLKINKQPGSRLTPGTSDILLDWKSPSDWPGYTYVLGVDTLELIVHPENPVESLSAGQILQIFNGEIQSWAVLNNEGWDHPVEVWNYPQGSEIRSFFFSLLRAAPSNPGGLLAPSPAEMLQAVAGNPGAVGYAPGKWVDARVKKVSFSDVDVSSVSLPIIANTNTPPDPHLKTWLACLQQSIQGKK